MSVYHGKAEFNFDVIGTVADMLGVTRREAKKQIFEKAIQTGRLPSPVLERKQYPAVDMDGDRYKLPKYSEEFHDQGNATNHRIGGCEECSDVRGWKGLEPELDDHGQIGDDDSRSLAWFGDGAQPPPPRETPGEPFRYRPGRFALGLRHLWEALIGPWTYQ